MNADQHGCGWVSSIRELCAICGFMSFVSRPVEARVFNAMNLHEASRRVGVPPTFILFIGSVFSTATDASDTVLGTAEMTCP